MHTVRSGGASPCKRALAFCRAVAICATTIAVLAAGLGLLTLQQWLPAALATVVVIALAAPVVFVFLLVLGMWLAAWCAFLQVATSAEVPQELLQLSAE